MELWLDTIDFDTIKTAQATGHLAGVTTNPTILGKADCLPETKLQQILDIQTGYVAAQVTADDLQSILREARQLAKLSNRIIVKIPVTASGLQAIAILEKDNIPTLATAIFEPSQVYLAALARAQYAAPYVGRITANIGNYVDAITDMLQIIQQQNFAIKLMAAAISSKEQIITCAKLGIPAITLPKNTYDDLLSTHPLTEQSLQKFKLDWLAGNHTQTSKYFS